MIIFYDFETSSRDLLGQILSYSFIVVNEGFEIIDACEGLVKLNPMQLPDPDAIWVNQLSIDDLQSQGASEQATAQRIYVFLDKYVTRFGQVLLSGFNSNAFDFSFL